MQDPSHNPQALRGREPKREGLQDSLMESEGRRRLREPQRLPEGFVPLSLIAAVVETKQPSRRLPSKPAYLDPTAMHCESPGGLCTKARGVCLAFTPAKSLETQGTRSTFYSLFQSQPAKNQRPLKLVFTFKIPVRK